MRYRERERESYHVIYFDDKRDQVINDNDNKHYHTYSISISIMKMVSTMTKIWVETNKRGIYTKRTKTTTKKMWKYNDIMSPVGLTLKQSNWHFWFVDYVFLGILFPIRNNSENDPSLQKKIRYFFLNPRIEILALP